ncbi:MAG: signal peptidase I [Candidatus Woesebacteria bacterium]|nr:signal peptidase I [Candidatus Woesebacteria bacterium]
MFKRLGAFFLDIGEVLVFAIGIFFFVYLLIMRPHKISGISMSPNYPDSEYLLTEKVSYYKNPPKRGDVVVFTPPVSSDDYIKRVVGLPGDNVSIKENHVYINNKLLKEDYLTSEVLTQGGSFLAGGQTYKVPDAEFFVMGDNRSHSYDSRSFGSIKKKVISGRAWIIYWPVSLAGMVETPNY